MNDTLKRELDYCGVTNLWSEGYTGQGVTVWNMENPAEGHGDVTEQCIKDIAPDCRVITVGASGNGDKDTYQGTVYYKNTLYTTEEFIDKFNISVITRSAISPDGAFIFEEGAKKEFWKKLIASRNLVVIAAGGNGISLYTYDNPQGSDIAILCGSCKLGANGQIVDCGDVFPNSDIDFTALKGDLSEIGQSGTSFAAPRLAGMAVLTRQKCGMLTQSELYALWVKIASGSGEWIDKRLGYGVPLLQCLKGVENMMEIKLTIGKPEMLVNGKVLRLDQPPVIDRDTGRTLVPLRAIAEAFGAEVEWNGTTKEITITGGEL